MIETYRDLCKRIKWERNEDVYDLAHEEHIRKIGDQPFDYERLKWIPEAKDVLKKLRFDGHQIRLLTSYDKEVFPKKAEFLDIYDIFDRKDVFVTEFKKTKENFVTAGGWKKEFDGMGYRWCAVGNGESDVRPAIEISEEWRGIYIPHGSTSQYIRGRRGMDYWSAISIDHPRVVTIRSIAELLRVI